jgi:hypothetical protein
MKSRRSVLEIGAHTHDYERLAWVKTADEIQGGPQAARNEPSGSFGADRESRSWSDQDLWAATATTPNMVRLMKN